MYYFYELMLETALILNTLWKNELLHNFAKPTESFFKLKYERLSTVSGSFGFGFSEL